MSEQKTGQDGQREVWYRSGAAARLAGLPVETLRVWERRYGLSDTERSTHGQRLYSEQQVKRLGLLKLLVDQGHPIGQLAALSVAQLREIGGARGADEAGEPIRLAVVGISLARRIAATEDGGRELAVVGHWARLELVTGNAGQGQGQAARGRVANGQAGQADVLVVELSELDESAIAGIAAARHAVGAAAVTVLYRFCASATIRALRSYGWLVARVPAEIGELASLCRAALAGQGVAAQWPTAPRESSAVAPRRFDDDALVELSAAGNRLACECPRHLADLLLMVGSFERYSAQCASRSQQDRLLHRELEQAAGRARTVLEHAMERLAVAEGIALPPP